jgi:16S rRNA pseudouridine516 synthase
MKSSAPQIRLDRLLASLGHGSRKQVQALVEAGQVQVDGITAKKADVRVHPLQVLLAGQPLEAPLGLLARFYKPTGYVCTHADGEGPTIYELLPARWLARNPAVTSIGRLDKDTSGLLLITDQGWLVQQLTSPRATVEKVYEVTVERELDATLVATFASGTVLLRGEDKPCLPAQLEITGTHTARLTLMEGRYHQVRRMFASQGWYVTALHRSRFGEYDLTNLSVGQWELMPLPE